MHRCLVFTVLAAALAGSVAAVARADSPRPDPDVAGLQTALAVKGFYHGPIDGLRGPLTSAALGAFQRHARLASTSVANGRTLSALGPLGRPRYGTRALQQGMVGRDVAALQFELRYHGFPNRGRGVFDNQTIAALKGFQRFAGLPPDGVAGHATYAALNQPPPAAPRIRSPLSNTQSATRVGHAVELACIYSSAVAAVAGGTVVVAGERPHGYGYTVVTRDARGFEVLYAHLARIDVSRGERVAPGALIGLAGWTGKKQPVTTLRLELHLRGAQLDAYSALYGH
jgi:peptidoglycan hydrolase-like protein with peptidoglycan-binding domain